VGEASLIDSKSVGEGMGVGVVSVDSARSHT